MAMLINFHNNFIIAAWRVKGTIFHIIYIHKAQQIILGCLLP